MINMSLRITLTIIAVTIGFLFFASPGQAGSFVVDGCTSNGWPAANTGISVQNLRVNPGSYQFVNFNAPTSSTWPGSSWATENPLVRGKRAFGGDVLRLYGPFNSLRSANDTIYDSHHFTSYGSSDCTVANTSGALKGQITRVGNIDTNGNNIYAVGVGSFSVRDFNTDGAPITAFGGRVLTYSAAEGCQMFETLCIASNGATKSYGKADLFWQAGVYASGAWKTGFKGDGSPSYASGGGNLAAGKVEEGGDVIAQTLDMTNSGATQIRLQVSCGAQGGCVNSSHSDRTGAIGAYLRAFSVAASYNGAMPITLQDNNPGSASVAVPAGWVKGTQSVTANGSDVGTGAGVLQVGARTGGSGGSTQTGTSTSLGAAGAGGVSCQSGRRTCSSSQAFSFDTTALTSGPVSVYGRSQDDAGNGWVESSAVTMNVDNQNPGIGSGCSLSATAPSGRAESSSDPNPGRVWVRGTKSVTGTACDALSGLKQTKTRYQTQAPGSSWGSWTDAPSPPGSDCTLNTAPGGNQTVTSSCSFNTTSLADGTAIRFLQHATDQLDWSASSAASSIVYVDNTAPPAAANVRFETFDDSQWKEITTGWTNAKKLRLRWNAISPGNGSPMHSYNYLFDPDPNASAEGSSSGSCTVQQPSGWQSMTATDSTEAFNENRADQCRQGTQQAWVWVQDVAGNGAGGVPLSAFKSAAVANHTTKYDSVPTPESRDQAWAKTDTLLPQSFKVYPTSLGLAGVGQWTTDNSFTASWTNPTVTNVLTQAPLLQARYQIGGGKTSSGALPVADVQSDTGCLGSGASCTLVGLKAPSEGSHPVKIWMQDAAGNSSLEQSAAGEINWRDGTCIQN